MLDKPSFEASAFRAFCGAGIPAIVTWLLILLVFVIPMLDSTRAPYFDLTQTFSQIAFWIAQSGAMFGMPIIAVSMLALLVTRNGITFQRRYKETGVVLLVLAIGAGGGAAINEGFVKTELRVPRPNIIWLAGENGSGPLGMTPEQFYETGNKEARREPLMDVLRKDPRPIPLSPSIEAHWIKETGYSFPSGHSFSAMFFATFFLGIAASYLKTRRIWLFYALLPWALAVCYSRVILRVHTPTDISVGGFEGLTLGLVAWAIARTLVRRL